MAWNKTKQQLESFICPSLDKRVEYRATGYRYAHDKSGRSYITVDKEEVFTMSNVKLNITWYKTLQEIKKDETIQIPVTEMDIEEVRKDNIPEEALIKMARNKKLNIIAESIMREQTILTKSDFSEAANQFMASSVDNCLLSENILLNIFALIDRRVGKKRLRQLSGEIKMKHPIVRYFYGIRCEAENIGIM